MNYNQVQLLCDKYSKQHGLPHIPHSLFTIWILYQKTFLESAFLFNFSVLWFTCNKKTRHISKRFYEYHTNCTCTKRDTHCTGTPSIFVDLFCNVTDIYWKLQFTKRCKRSTVAQSEQNSFSPTQLFSIAWSETFITSESCLCAEKQFITERERQQNDPWNEGLLRKQSKPW